MSDWDWLQHVDSDAVAHEQFPTYETVLLERPGSATDKAVQAMYEAETARLKFIRDARERERIIAEREAVAKAKQLREQLNRDRMIQQQKQADHEKWRQHMISKGYSILGSPSSLGRRTE